MPLFHNSDFIVNTIIVDGIKRGRAQIMTRKTPGPSKQLKFAVWEKDWTETPLVLTCPDPTPLPTRDHLALYFVTLESRASES
jgi:hypothetical protein